jgi:choice-of-anchor C domain-containing protein
MSNSDATPLSKQGQLDTALSLSSLTQTPLEDKTFSLKTAISSDGAGGVVIAGTPDTAVTVRFTWFEREAVFNNEAGVYLTDAQGRVGGLAPTDAGYANAVLTSATRTTLFTSGQHPLVTTEATFNGGDRLAFYIIQNNTSQTWLSTNPQNAINACDPLAFFSINAANPDHFDHAHSMIRSDGYWQVNWEDLTYGGDQDFDDVVFKIEPISAQTTKKPQLSIGDIRFTEGDRGFSPAQFTATLSAAATMPVTVAYTTADATAKAGTDYQAISGQLTFAPGEISKTIAVQIAGDLSLGADRTFSVTFSDPQNAVLTTPQAIATIIDNDTAAFAGTVTKVGTLSNTLKIDLDQLDTSLAQFKTSLASAQAEFAQALQAGEIRGTVWNDLNGNRRRDVTGTGAASSEPGMAGVQVYLDLNNNGQLDAAEPTQLTAADDPVTLTINEQGQYWFTGLAPGSYTVREILPSGYTQTFPGTTSGVNLIRNGSFESGTAALNQYRPINPNSIAINDWTVTKGQVDYIGAEWKASDGKRSIDLDGTPGPGGIAQTFATVPNQRYQVKFDLAGNALRGLRDSAPIKQVRVSAAGQSADFSYDVRGRNYGNPSWQPETWTFTATGTQTTLTFSSLSPAPSYLGPIIDNVAVRENSTVTLAHHVDLGAAEIASNINFGNTSGSANGAPTIEITGVQDNSPRTSAFLTNLFQDAIRTGLTKAQDAATEVTTVTEKLRRAQQNLDEITALDQRVLAATAGDNSSSATFLRGFAQYVLNTAVSKTSSLTQDLTVAQTKLTAATIALDEVKTRINSYVTPLPSATNNFNFPAANQPLVGVIDTGFAKNNPDIDYSRITAGKDLVDGDTDPFLTPGQGSEHGTAVLGAIAATRGNNIGIDGINDKAPVWVGRATGSGNWATSLKEFVDAAKAANKPNAIALLAFDLTQTNPDGSVTTRYKLTQEEVDALNYARDNHIVVVVAAGNQDGALSALGQASQWFDNVVTVGAATGAGKASYSSFGQGLTLVATGGDNASPVLSTVGNDVGVMVGTSIAAAEVAGAVSEVWAANPALNYQQIIAILKNTATDLAAPGYDPQTGAGRLNLNAAVAQALLTTPATLPASSTGTIPILNIAGLSKNSLVERAANAGVLPRGGDALLSTIIIGRALSAINSAGKGLSNLFLGIALVLAAATIVTNETKDDAKDKPVTDTGSGGASKPPTNSGDTTTPDEDPLPIPTPKPDDSGRDENQNEYPNAAALAAALAEYLRGRSR